MSKAPLKEEDYPRYFKVGNVLLAFKSPNRMYKIEAIGSNKNDGITIDLYTTRKMVMYYWPGSDYRMMDAEDFKDLLTKLYGAYIEKIVDCE